MDLGIEPGHTPQACCPRPSWDSALHILVQGSLASPAVIQVVLGAAHAAAPEGASDKPQLCPCGVYSAGFTECIRWVAKKVSTWIWKDVSDILGAQAETCHKNGTTTKSSHQGNTQWSHESGASIETLELQSYQHATPAWESCRHDTCYQL